MLYAIPHVWFPTFFFQVQAPYYPPYMPYHPQFAPFMTRPYIPSYGANRMFSTSRMPQRPVATNIQTKPHSKETDKSVSEKTGENLHAMRHVPYVQPRTRLVYVPRYPMTYNPYLVYPHQPYHSPYFIPDDARAVPFPPYVSQFPHSPYMGQPVYGMPQFHTSGVHHVDVSVDGPAQRLSRMETDRHKTLSPGSSPSPSLAGKNIKLLPNVKHVPVHLRDSPGPPGTRSSDSSPPVSAASPISLPLSPQSSVDDDRNFSDNETQVNTAKASVIPSLYDRRTRTNSPLSKQYKANTEVGIKGTDRKTTGSPASLSSCDSPSPDSGYGPSNSDVPNSKPEKSRSHQLYLKLPTGFSRQFSDDLETPTEITDLVRMIEESIEEKDEEKVEDIVSNENQTKSVASSQKLYLNLPSRTRTRSESPNSPLSTSPSSQNDERPTYAGMVRRRLPSWSPTSHDMDMNTLEPQTPRTPAGFITPSTDTDTDTDPLGLLKNLNINGTASNQKVYQYFS